MEFFFYSSVVSVMLDVGRWMQCPLVARAAVRSQTIPAGVTDTHYSAECSLLGRL
jgi:hypothetical protein